MERNKLAEATVNGKTYWLMQGEHSQGCHACVFDGKPECDSSVTNACIGKNWAYFKEAPQTTGEKAMSNTKDTKKSHRWAEVIKAWADGAEIEFRHHGDKWNVDMSPTWEDHIEYRVKPEKVFPTTTLGYSDLYTIYQQNDIGIEDSCKDVADAAIKRFIESGEMAKWIEANK